MPFPHTRHFFLKQTTLISASKNDKQTHTHKDDIRPSKEEANMKVYFLQQVFFIKSIRFCT